MASPGDKCFSETVKENFKGKENSKTSSKSTRALTPRDIRASGMTVR